MTTNKKPRHGTLAHYRERVAELANENAALKSAAYDATVGELVCQMRATIATERAEQAERERDGETARAGRLSAALTRITARHGQQTTALCRAREDLAEESRTVEILTAELDTAKSAYASARLSCDELAGQVMALQVRLGEAQAASIAQYDARRRAERIGVAGICVALACIVAQVGGRCCRERRYPLARSVALCGPVARRRGPRCVHLPTRAP
jgi:chromosome segregation ATPase